MKGLLFVKLVTYRLIIVFSLVYLCSCGGSLYDYTDLPVDPCFQGEYFFETESWEGDLRALVRHEYSTQTHSTDDPTEYLRSNGQISFAVHWFGPADLAWESLRFTGSVMEVGEAEGTLLVDFGFNSSGEHIYYEANNTQVDLEGSTTRAGLCSEVTGLILSFSYPELLNPNCFDDIYNRSPLCPWNHIDRLIMHKVSR